MELRAVFLHNSAVFSDPSPPHWPCAYRPADPGKSAEPLSWPPKSHPKFHSIVEGILAPKMVPKASQNGAKIEPKPVIFSPSFSSRFSLVFLAFFPRFSRCRTLDLIAIYSVSVGCAIFRKVGKSEKKKTSNNHQHDTKHAAKGLQKCIQKRRQKTT